VPRIRTARPSDYRFPFLVSPVMCLAARTAKAMIVRVGFFSGNVVKQLPSVTNRFLTSRAWLNAFYTDVRGSFPMRTVPTS
jgi:hypothetical protein